MPEGLYDDMNIVEGTGYSGDKWVAEHLIAEAARQSSLSACIVRVG